MFQNLPEEIKVYNQWLVWRYEDLEAKKPTKVPYCPHSYKQASVTNPQTWGSFDDACKAHFNGNFSGIGFVLTENDPFTFIDLDNPYEFDIDGQAKFANPGEIMDRQIRIHDTFNSYSERSPSGQGLHIIVKASVPSGRRKQAVEVYSTARYMTMTGQVFNNAAIQPKQDLVSMLWQEMSGKHNSSVVYEGEEKEINTDEEILLKAADASNGIKFKALYDGRWSDYYSSQSEGDYALINIISFYTQNKTQIKRIFRSSMLGVRPKARREDYVMYMINKSFDRMLPPIDMTDLKKQMNLIIEKKTTPAFGPIVKELPKSKTNKNDVYIFPPGIVGEVAEFIFEQSIYPVKEIALIASLALMSGICGKAYNISGTGLNNYFVLLAKTGRGKEAMAKGIDKLISEIKKTTPNCVDYLGPAEFASPQGLVKHLNEKPCFMSIFTEFAMMLKQLTSINANANVSGLRRMFLNLYNKSGHGQTLGGIVYSDRDKNVHSLNAPAFSFLGECTPEKYYRLLDEDLISEGLLPRFTTFEYLGERCKANKHHHLVNPSEELIRKLSGLCSNSNMLISNKNINVIQMDEEASIIFNMFNDEKCNSEINKSDINGVSAELWTRSHVKALKLAALVAIGQNPYHPLVTKAEADWAIKIICFDNENIISRFENGEVSSNNIDFSQIKEMQRISKDYINGDFEELNKKYKTLNQDMHRMRIIPWKYLNQRLGPLACYRTDKIGATNAMKRTAQSLIDSGDFQEVPVGQVEREFGSRQKCFSVKIKNV